MLVLEGDSRNCHPEKTIVKTRKFFILKKMLLLLFLFFIRILIFQTHIKLLLYKNVF